MVGVVQDRLISTGHLKWPEVYFSPELEPKYAARLRDIVKSHQGKIVTSSAKATHIIEHKQEGDPSEDPELEYLRTIDHNNKMNLIHWWYCPDSYDTWLPATDVQGEQPDPDPPHHGVWRVSPRFITDLELYNEWMNELDYEIEEEEGDASNPNRGRGRGRGRKGSRRRPVEEEDPKKMKVKGRKREGDEDEVDAEGDEEGRVKRGGSPLTPGGTPKEKKSKKDDTGAESFKIKIPRDVMVC